MSCNSATCTTINTVMTRFRDLHWAGSRPQMLPILPPWPRDSSALSTPSPGPRSGTESLRQWKPSKTQYLQVGICGVQQRSPGIKSAHCLTQWPPYLVLNMQVCVHVHVSVFVPGLDPFQTGHRSIQPRPNPCTPKLFSAHGGALTAFIRYVVEKEATPITGAQRQADAGTRARGNTVTQGASEIALFCWQVYTVSVKPAEVFVA